MPFKDPQKRKEFNKQYYQENRLILIEKQKLYDLKNIDKVKEYRKQYQQTESYKQIQRKSQIKWNEINRDKLNTYSRKWRKNNIESVYNTHKKYLDRLCISLNLTNYMVKRALYFWSKAVRERDGNKCIECGNLERLHAHHVLEKSNYPEFALILANGMTVCHDCHWNIHRDQT